MCIVQKKTEKGLEYACVTKNPAVLEMHRDRIVEEDRRRGFKPFKRQLSFDLAELNHNAFEAVRLFWDGTGFHVDRYRVGSRSQGFVFPYYTVANFAWHFLKELRVRTVRLFYLDAQGRECPLVTTYHGGYGCSGVT